MQLIRPRAVWRPDTVEFRDPVLATRISLRSLAGWIIELNDKIADLDSLIEPLVRGLARQPVATSCIGIETRRPAPGHARWVPSSRTYRTWLRDPWLGRALACLIWDDPATPAQPWWVIGKPTGLWTTSIRRGSSAPRYPKRFDPR